MLLKWYKASHKPLISNAKRSIHIYVSPRYAVTLLIMIHALKCMVSCIWSWNRILLMIGQRVKKGFCISWTKLSFDLMAIDFLKITLTLRTSNLIYIWCQTNGFIIYTNLINIASSPHCIYTLENNVIRD